MLSPVARTRLGGLFLLLAVTALDQWSKAIVSAHAGEFPMDILPFFSLVLVHNHGISFGFMNHMPGQGALLLTLGIAGVALALTVWFLLCRDTVTLWALAL